MSSICVFERFKRFKEGHEKVKDEYMNKRSSTSRTGVNIKDIKQVACSDRRLIVQMIASQLDMKKESVWKIITEDLGISEK